MCHETLRVYKGCSCRTSYYKICNHLLDRAANTDPGIIKEKKKWQKMCKKKSGEKKVVERRKKNCDGKCCANRTIWGSKKGMRIKAEGLECQRLGT
jgi:hypothetical protein